MDDKFKDWIPEGEDPGAIGKDGFQDFVPSPTPQPQVIGELPQVGVEFTEPVVPPLEGGQE